MPIHPELLERIENRLGVSRRRAYDIIAQKSRELHISTKLAALAVAAENGIGINKKAYATEEERAELRNVALAKPAVSPAHPILPSIPVRSAATRPRKATKPRIPERKSNTVMVVHGRNLAVRDAMFTFLRALNLKPLEWSAGLKATKKGAPFVGEVIDKMFEEAAAVVVLLTPDDDARLKRKFLSPMDGPHERTLTGQPRPNVLFEAGLAFGRHPNSTILVQVGSIRPISDTAGRHLIHLTNDPARRNDLAARLETAGCAVDRTGEDWYRAGDFTL